MSFAVICKLGPPFGRFRWMKRSSGELRKARGRCAAWRLLESTRKIKTLGKKFGERPGKPGDSEELVSFRQIALLYIINRYNMRMIHGRRRWPPEASSKCANRARFASFAASPRFIASALAQTPRTRPSPSDPPPAIDPSRLQGGCSVDLGSGHLRPMGAQRIAPMDIIRPHLFVSQKPTFGRQAPAVATG